MLIRVEAISEAAILAEMSRSWTSRENTVNALGGEKAAIDELALRGCNSGAAVRAMARQLLFMYFNIPDDTLPCLPCE